MKSILKVNEVGGLKLPKNSKKNCADHGFDNKEEKRKRRRKEIKKKDLEEDK